MSEAAHAFTATRAERERDLLPRLQELTEHHRRSCEPYRRLLDALGTPSASYDDVADVPWLPVRVFKEHDLKSIPDEEVFRVLTSSGTTGNTPSRIHLDRAAAAAQPRHLARTLQVVCGARRLPMLVVDSGGLVGDRRSFSARAAGVLGTSTLGRDHVYVLGPDGAVDEEGVVAFLQRHGNQPFLVFGFTFLVWQFLLPLAERRGLDLSKGLLLHSGGWKKLVDQSVDDIEFRRRLARACGLTRISNYYGMVEQLGTVFLQPPHGGELYCPDFADVVVRDPHTFAEQPVGVPGLLEVVSSVPRSYPGHALLTEDLGVVHGVDDGFWPGKRFSVLGRLPRAEVRGCSDTFAGAAS